MHNKSNSGWFVFDNWFATQTTGNAQKRHARLSVHPAAQKAAELRTTREPAFRLIVLVVLVILADALTLNTNIILTIAIYNTPT